MIVVRREREKQERERERELELEEQAHLLPEPTDHRKWAGVLITVQPTDIESGEARPRCPNHIVMRQARLMPS